MSTNQTRRTLIKYLSLAAVSSAAMSAARSYAKSPYSVVYTSDRNNDAVEGYDTVSYFKNGTPVMGSQQFNTMHKNARWLFSSEENLQTFSANPDFYMPQYGGYCAFSVTKGNLVRGDATLWAIVDGKLYVNYNKGVHRLWLKRSGKMIKKANKNWPAILG